MSNLKIYNDYEKIKKEITDLELNPLEVVLAKELKKKHPDFSLHKKWGERSFIVKDGIILGNIFFMYGLTDQYGVYNNFPCLDFLLKMLKENNIDIKINATSITELEQDIAKELLSLENIKGIDFNQKHIESFEDLLLKYKSIINWLNNEKFSIKLGRNYIEQTQEVSFCISVGRKNLPDSFYHYKNDSVYLGTFESENKTFVSITLNNGNKDSFDLENLKAHINKYLKKIELI